MSLHAALSPLSYDVCREFVVTFDELYEHKPNTADSLPNPMRKSSESLHDKTVDDIFRHTQFPIRYWFIQEDTGIADKTFSTVDTPVRRFSIVHSKRGAPPKAFHWQPSPEAIERIHSGTDSGSDGFVRPYNRDDVYQHFYLSEEGRFDILNSLSQLSPGGWFTGTREDDVAFQRVLGHPRDCREGNVVKYLSNREVEELGNYNKQFKVTKEGRIESGEKLEGD